jgi:hypothetical protein
MSLAFIAITSGNDDGTAAQRGTIVNFWLWKNT